MNWQINELYVSCPADRFDDAAVALLSDPGLLLADENHEAAECTVIGWYHKRDLAHMSDLYGLGVLVNR